MTGMEETLTSICIFKPKSVIIVNYIQRTNYEQCH